MSFFSRKKRHPSSNFHLSNGLTVTAQSTREQPPQQLSQSHAQQNQQLSSSNSLATNGLTTSPSAPYQQQQPFPGTPQLQPHSPQTNQSTPNSPPTGTDGLTTSQSTQHHPLQQQPFRSASQSQLHSPQANEQLSTSNSLSTNSPTSQSTQQQPSQGQLFPTRSQSQPHTPQADQQPWLLCTWSAHSPQPEPSPSPFPRHGHALTATATTTGELFLFGGYTHESASDDLYVISTRDLSARQLRARGVDPGPRIGHAALLSSTILLIWGGKTNFSEQNAVNQRQDDSLNLLNLGALCS